MIDETTKSRAKEFLKALKADLLSQIRSPREMQTEIKKTVAAAKHDPSMKHMRQPEDAFLYRYVFPAIRQRVADLLGTGKAQEAILSEYFRNMQEFCVKSPARTRRHPFSKELQIKPHSLMAKWRGEPSKAFTKACPDIALNEPFKIVFEGKYFATNSSVVAETTLVRGIYEAIFYRGLPYVPPNGQSPAWDYDFACLVACDVSRDGDLKAAWRSLRREVKNGFWDGANIYVMIL